MLSVCGFLGYGTLTKLTTPDIIMVEDGQDGGEKMSSRRILTCIVSAPSLTSIRLVNRIAEWRDLDAFHDRSPNLQHVELVNVNLDTQLDEDARLGRGATHGFARLSVHGQQNERNRGLVKNVATSMKSFEMSLYNHGSGDDWWQDHLFKEALGEWMLYLGEKYKYLKDVSVTISQPTVFAMPSDLSYLEPSLLQAISNWKDLERYDIALCPMPENVVSALDINTSKRLEHLKLIVERENLEQQLKAIKDSKSI